MSGDKKRTQQRTKQAKPPVAKGARRRQRSGQGPRRSDMNAPAMQARPGLSVTVQIPPLRRPSLKKPTSARGFSKSKALVVMGLVLIVAVVIGLTLHKDSTAPATVAAADQTSPDFKPLVPSAEKASESRYDAKRDLVTYTTVFSGARITVSQQPLPANFAKDPKAITKAADTIKATKQLETARGDLHIASNETEGNQLAVVALPKVLLFIHVDRQLDDVSWRSFIELLEEK